MAESVLSSGDIERVVFKILSRSSVTGADELSVEVEDSVIYLCGTLGRWSDVVEVGHAIASRPGLSNFVCEVTADDLPQGDPSERAGISPIGSFPTRSDVVVVGGGIVGLAIARGLIRYGLEVLVLEAGHAIGGAATSWNNGMIHSGLDPTPGTLKARLNVRGNLLWPDFAKELDLPILRTGSLLVALDDDGVEQLNRFYGRARANGVPGAELIDGEQAIELEPALNTRTVAALWTPTTAYIDSVEATRAMAQDVQEHGGRIVLGAPVDEIAVEDGRVTGVGSGVSQIETNLVVNAAGINADKLAALAGCQRYSIHPRKGTLVIFQSEAAAPFRRAVGLPPLPYTKGGGLTPRPGGVMVGGPSASEQPGRERPIPEAGEVDEILEKGADLLPEFPFDAVREVGSGLRAATYSEDFVIESSPKVRGFFDAAGMQSPGVASVPATVELTLEMLQADALIERRDDSVRFVTRAERRGRRADLSKGGENV